jgi:SAM-dependent methyltransferase
MSTDQVRRAYAARTDEYVARLGSVAEMPSPDGELIASWSSGIAGAVLDAGCGPGHWTAFLHDRGVTVEGVDLVPEFIAGARQRFPQASFRVAELDDLPVPDGTLGGLLSWYSVIHTPPDQVGRHLVEFARCLGPGGSLLLGFFEGEALAPFDHAVVTAYFWPVEAMRQELAAAGFETIETHTRTDPGRRPHAAVVARRLGP